MAATRIEGQRLTQPPLDLILTYIPADDEGTAAPEEEQLIQEMLDMADAEEAAFSQ